MMKCHQQTQCVFFLIYLVSVSALRIVLFHCYEYYLPDVTNIFTRDSQRNKLTKTIVY